MNVARRFGHLKLTKQGATGLREAIRPFAQLPEWALVSPHCPSLPVFCKKLYLLFYRLEADDELEAVQLEVSSDDCLLINHFLNQEDGEWAADLLRQSRQALYEREEETS